MSGFFELQRFVKVNVDGVERVIRNPFMEVGIEWISEDTLMVYEIKDGQRPDNVSQELYNTDIYAWTFFFINGMTHDQWPLEKRALYRKIEMLYGDRKNEVFYYEDANGVRYNEKTYPKGFYDENGNLLNFWLDKDKIAKIGLSDDPAVDDRVLFNDAAVVPVTYEEHMLRENERFRNILVVRPEYIERFVSDYLKRVNGE